MHIDKINYLQFVKVKSIRQIKCFFVCLLCFSFLQSLQKWKRPQFFWLMDTGKSNFQVSLQFTTAFRNWNLSYCCYFFCILIASLTVCSFRNSNLLPLREKYRYSEIFWSAFSRIWTEYGVRYSISLRIQSECEKIRTKITRNTDTFYVVYSSSFHNWRGLVHIFWLI